VFVCVYGDIKLYCLCELFLCPYNVLLSLAESQTFIILMNLSLVAHLDLIKTTRVGEHLNRIQEWNVEPRILIDLIRENELIT